MGTAGAMTPTVNPEGAPMNPARYICVHGHFYQPPRENPWLEAIEVQDSAYPYHDWNERVTSECYAPNSVSRLLDSNRRIARLVNNYASISFNFGPTLLSWMENKAPKVYQAILEGEKCSRERFGGHGSALAQAYNHMIMPLANRRDKVTQVKWGMTDFERRFGRKPRGMWLPETAVDTETLDVMAEHGIAFTILAPRQAAKVRRFGSRKWKDVGSDRIDPSRAYLVRLPSRRTISVFFYDGPISRAVAFEGLLNDGKHFAERLLSGFSDERDRPQLSHIATDGESYGHHHPYGEMALTYALQHIEANKLAELTNYSQFLELHPPDHFVEIAQDTSWSCIHGVERWRNNCGCNSGGNAGWNQEWRAQLRSALDWLRDAIAPSFESKAGELLKDPWNARDEYIRVILDRSPDNLSGFFAEHAKRPLNDGEVVTALKLLEMQRHALLMYTSCGWFFDELSGLETVQIIHYAGRALQLAQELCGGELEGEFLNRLRNAKSNLAEHGDGARIYEKWVRHARVDIPEVGGHYAISSLFEQYGDNTQVYCYEIDRQDFNLEAEGKMRLAVGRARFSSRITRESSELTFGALHMGDHNLVAGVRGVQEKDYQALKQKLAESFAKADTTELIRLIDENFGEKMYTLRNLFRDEQRKVLRLILNDSLTDAAAAYRSIYEPHAQLMRMLNDLGVPIPKAFQTAAGIALNSQLRQAFRNGGVDTDHVRSLLKEAASNHVELDVPTLEYAIRKKTEECAGAFVSDPENCEAALKLKRLLDLIESLPFGVNLWEAQNTVYGALAKFDRKARAAAGNGNSDSQHDACPEALRSIQEKLSLQMP
jgi:alpha-amylase/alpha-mannosidase (GH57 family)